MIFNKSADFWFYEIGVNVIPINSKEKATYVKWSEFQGGPISEEQYLRWKAEGAFNQGIAIIAGKIWRGKYKGKYLACIDIDNKKGVEEFLSHFDEIDTIEKLAAKTIVEWHKDNPNKVHIYFVVEKPLTKKSGLRVYNQDNLNDENEIPAIEVKSEGSHGIMIVCPSIHKNGHPYEIIGTKTPTVLNEAQSEALENSLNLIYNKYNKNNHNSEAGTLTPIAELFKPEFTVTKGNNRHEVLLRVMEALIQRNKSILSINQIRQIAWEYNLSHFKPPLDEKEFEKQWKDALNFILKKSENNHEENGKPEVENKEIEYLKDIKQRYISIFYDQLNRLYVTIKINNHVEHIPLDSNRFKSLVRKEILEKENKTINNDKIDRIIKSIEAEAIFDENIHRKELSIRVAADSNNTFYYDFTNGSWEIAKFTSEGWDIIKDNPIPLFKRYENNCRPQVHPIKDDNNEQYFKKFMKLFNLRTEKDRMLLETYLISLFIPGIQKAILVISGNGGGAKTTTFSLLKNIIDPGTVDTLSFSSNKNELIQALEHNYVNYFDNVSNISQEVSDTLCRAVTGSGDSKRELYTTDGVFVYKFKRCIGVNGINLVTTRADFIDRALILRVERIPEEMRKKEEDIRKEFEKLRPFVLGYIFDILVKYLRYKEKHNGVVIKNPPRMADFAETCEIISRCLGYPENAFIETYRENIDNQNDEIIESSPVAESIIAFMDNKKSWLGTPTQLLQQLGDIISQVDSNIRKSRFWPKGPGRLTYRINEIVPNLLKRSIEVVIGEKINGQRAIRITKVDSNHTSREKNDSEPNLSSNHSQDLSTNYINPYIHRRGSSDIFDCEKCSLTGDIHFMKDHQC